MAKTITNPLHSTTAITLNQYYNEMAKKFGWSCWDSYIANTPAEDIEQVKMLLKKYFNTAIKNKERQKEWRQKQKENKNVRKK